MKKILIVCMALLLVVPMAAQKEAQAKALLDKTAAAFRKAEGIQADFGVKVYERGTLAGTAEGTIQLRGDKFMLTTPETLTWFDGKTQWSYVVANEEVTVSTPTGAELQSLNPYALLTLYQKGFSYKMGTTQSMQGKAVSEVILTPDTKQDILGIVLYVAKDSGLPLFIRLEQRNKSYSEITVKTYKTGQKYADSRFTFDARKYPRAEVIDLR